MSYVSEMTGDICAGIPRAATNGWVFTVDDQDIHGRLLACDFQSGDYGCVVTQSAES